MSKARTIGYENQSRCKRPGQEWSEWSPTCEGHKDMYGAMHCQEVMIGVMRDGNIEQITNPLLGQMLIQQSQLLRGTGAELEMRICKVTISEEQVDEPVSVFHAPPKVRPGGGS